jgi:hypothetical protein
LDWLWPCPQILRPDWKGFPRSNPIAYWALSLVIKEKSFITLTPGQNFYKTFFFFVDAVGHKLLASGEHKKHITNSK